MIKLADAFQPGVGGDLIAINSRHARALDEASRCLAAAKAGLADRTSGELVASELRGALDAYGQVAGKVDSESVLDQVFASFCIGK